MSTSGSDGEACGTETAGQMKRRHRAELMALKAETDAEARAIKKTDKAAKKAQLERAAERERAMKARHAEEVQRLEQGASAAEQERVAEEERAREQANRERAERMQRERDAAIVAEREAAERRAELAARAPGTLEQAAIEAVLAPLGLRIADVPSDGHCLYRAVALCAADQGVALGAEAYRRVRKLASDRLLANREHCEPFAELAPGQSYAAYCDEVANGAAWGGHLELQALADALRVDVVVYRAEAGGPLRFVPQAPAPTEPSGIAVERPITLSYHRQLFRMGEHYQAVVAAEPVAEGDNGAANTVSAGGS